MKTNYSKTTLLAAALLIPLAIQAASTVTFDNKSGEPALVKLIGPTASSVSVENSKKESVSVTPGHYFIKVRYGVPAAYYYSKGDEFDVTETATSASDISITLHKVVAGNYGSKTITQGEFDTGDVAFANDRSLDARDPEPAGKAEKPLGAKPPVQDE